MLFLFIVFYPVYNFEVTGVLVFFNLLPHLIKSLLGSRDWRRSNERHLRKTRKILRRKGCHFYCSKFDTLTVSCWLTNFFWTLLKKVLSIWKWSISDLLTPFVKAILSECGALKSKETRLCERNGNTFTLNSYCIYPCSCFHFTVNEISRNKTKNCPRRLTTVASRGGAAVRALASHQCGLGSIPGPGVICEFSLLLVLWDSLLSEVFFRLLRFSFSSITNISKFQLDRNPKVTVCLVRSFVRSFIHSLWRNLFHYFSFLFSTNKSLADSLDECVDPKDPNFNKVPTGSNTTLSLLSYLQCFFNDLLAISFPLQCPPAMHLFVKIAILNCYISSSTDFTFFLNSVRWI